MSDEAVRAERVAAGASRQGRSPNRDQMDVVALSQLEVKAVLLCVPCCFVL
jgi:hypothetical protein